MDRKSQAALEFLTTYGWAFLIILIMIGTLAYFGILSPSKLTPNRCNFPSEFQCLDYKIDSVGNTFNLKLKNNVGDTINIDVGKITVSSETATTYNCPTPLTGSPAIPTWATGEQKDITLTSCNTALAGFIAGEKAKVLVSIDYYILNSGNTYTRTVKGEVYASVQ